MVSHVAHSTEPVQQVQTIECRFSRQLTLEYPRIIRNALERVYTELWVTLNDHMFKHDCKARL